MDVIHAIDIETTTKELYLEDSPEQFLLRGLDDEGERSNLRIRHFARGQGIKKVFIKMPNPLYGPASSINYFRQYKSKNFAKTSESSAVLESDLCTIIHIFCLFLFCYRKCIQQFGRNVF